MEQKALPTILTFFYKPVVSWRYPNMEAQLCSVHKLLYLLIIGKMICIDFILYNYPLNTNISSLHMNLIQSPLFWAAGEI